MLNGQNSLDSVLLIVEMSRSKNNGQLIELSLNQTNLSVRKSKLLKHFFSVMTF